MSRNLNLFSFLYEKFINRAAAPSKYKFKKKKKKKKQRFCRHDKMSTVLHDLPFR
jgi:hypothetical protein